MTAAQVFFLQLRTRKFDRKFRKVLQCKIFSPIVFMIRSHIHSYLVLSRVVLFHTSFSWTINWNIVRGPEIPVY